MCRALCSVDCTFYQTAEGALHLFHFYFHFSMAMYHHQCASSGWCICRWTCWFSHVWHTKLADFPIIRSVSACSRDHLLIIRWSFPQSFHWKSGIRAPDWLSNDCWVYFGRKTEERQFMSGKSFARPIAVNPELSGGKFSTVFHFFQFSSLFCPTCFFHQKLPLPRLCWPPALLQISKQ